MNRCPLRQKSSVTKVKRGEHLKGIAVTQEFRRGIEHDREGRREEDCDIDDEHGCAYDRLLILDRTQSVCYSTRKQRHSPDEMEESATT